MKTRTIIAICMIATVAGVMIAIFAAPGAGSSAPRSALWVDSTPMVQVEPGVKAFIIGGNIRPNSPDASAGWHIIDDANHDAPGLLGVTCLSNGILRVSYPPTVRVGVLQANPDEGWVGKFQAGGSQGFSYTDFKITSRSGSKVPCNSTSLTSAGNWTVMGLMFYSATD